MTSPRDMGRGRAPLPAGTVLVGKYRIERVLGEGGMGTVYAAYHVLLDRPVALKLLASDAAMNPEAVARFLNEARNAARVDNEYVCRVMDLGVLAEGQPFIAMELLEGIDLGRLLEQRGPLPVVEAVGYVIQALTGIGMAHLMGVIHRDLKPSNLFLANKPDGGRIVKVLDFGISKATGGRQNVTSMSNLIGSPAYMSPEQVNLAPNIDRRSDLWALGVMLYQLITGTLPFASPNVAEVLAFILEKDPVPPSTLRPDVPPGLEAVMARCLAKDPDRRFQSAAELALALAPFGPWAAAGARIGALPDSSDQGGAVTTPGVWTHKSAAPRAATRSPYLRMVGIGAAIGVTLLAGLVVAASWKGAPRAAGTTDRLPAASATAVAAAAPTSPPASAVASASAAPSPSAAPLASVAPIVEAAPSSTVRPGTLGPLRRPALSRQRQ
jgi:serine/threonine-protein kinase